MLSLAFTFLALASCNPAMGDAPAALAIEQRAVALMWAYQVDFDRDGATQRFVES